MAEWEGLARRYRRRDQGVRGRRAGPEPARTQPQTYPRSLRQVAPAPQNGLRRPLPDPSMGLHDADRRDARCARLAGARGKGALPRRLEHGGVAVLEGVIHREGARMAAVRLDAEPLQPRLT